MTAGQAALASLAVALLAISILLLARRARLKMAPKGRP